MKRLFIALTALRLVTGIVLARSDPKVFVPKTHESSWSFTGTEAHKNVLTYLGAPRFLGVEPRSRQQ